MTGAACVGEQLAKHLAVRGSNLQPSDRDEARLAAVADRIARDNPTVTARITVFDLDAIENLPELAEDVIKDGVPTLLVNNAGIALGGQFERLTLEEFDWVMRVNSRAAVGLTHNLLPALLRSPGSHVVNVSSVYGLVTPRGQSAYVASKFALRGFSDVLRLELFDHGVGVTDCLSRRGTNTNRRELAPRRRSSGPGVRSWRDWVAGRLTYPPERAAAEILAAVQRRRPRVLITQTAHFLDVIARLAPAGQAEALERVFGRDRHRRARAPRHTALSIER